MTKKLSSLSVYFPAYRDEHTIEPLVRKAIEVGRQLTDNLEILIVDDASPDNVGIIADRLAQEFREVRVIHHPRNLGVGAAMAAGYTQSAKDYVFYTDGDAQYDLNELIGFAQDASQDLAIIGYRIKRAEGWPRVLTSRIFHLLMFLFFGLRFRDIDTSFKLIPRKLLGRVEFRTGGGLIDSELLIQARRMRFPIKEIGVHHYPRQFGRSQCLRPKLVLSMLYDIARLRWMYWVNPPKVAKNLVPREITRP